MFTLDRSRGNTVMGILFNPAGLLVLVAITFVLALGLGVLWIVDCTPEASTKLRKHLDRLPFYAVATLLLAALLVNVLYS